MASAVRTGRVDFSTTILLSLAIDRIISMLQGALPAERTYIYLIFDSQAFISAVERVFWNLEYPQAVGKAFCGLK